MPTVRMMGLLAAVVALMVAISAAIYAFWLGDPSVIEENHLVEWSQVALLLLAAAVHVTITPLHHWAGERPLRVGLALLCISLAIREVDIDRLGDWPNMQTVETTLRTLTVVGWIFYAGFAVVHVPAWWRQRFGIAGSALGVFTAVGCVLYAASWPFDKYPEHFGDMARLFEETIQLNATLLLFLAAWVRWPRRGAALSSGRVE